MAIVALVVLNVVLVALALRPRSAAEPLSITVAPPSTSTEGASSPATSPTPTKASSPTPTAAAVEAVPLRLLLSAVSAQVAWRGRSAACGEAGSKAVVERTTDGGATWAADPVPDPVVMRVNARSERSAFAVSATDGCDPRLRTTGGDGWGDPSAVDNAWYRSPSDPTKIGVPGGKSVRPCADSQAVIDLVADSASRAAVLCADSRVRRTKDGGGSWSDVATTPGALAVADDPDGSGYVAAVAGAEGCDGLAVVEVSKSQTSRGCVAEATDATPGEVALSSGDGATWLASGSTVFVSTDDARTFASPRS